MFFINQEIDFIDLTSIFRGNLVISSIQTYFQNTETPISITNLFDLLFLNLLNLFQISILIQILLRYESVKTQFIAVS